MQSETKPSLNDRILDRFQGENTALSVYLANGIRLNGKVIEFDHDTLVITSENGPEGIAISRANIATIMRCTNEHNRQEGGKSTQPQRRGVR